MAFLFPLELAFSAIGTVRAEVRLTQPDASTLTLPRPAGRFITLAPHLTELAYAAGAGHLVRATVEYSEYPPAARGIPRIGDAFRLDIERIVALKPDLVVAWESGNPSAALRQLESLGIPVWSVEIRVPGEIAQVLEAFGAAAGTKEAAEAAAAAFRERLGRLSARYAGVPTLDYFYQVDVKPLFTLNGQHLMSKGLSLCGGRNIFREQPALAFQVAHESVVVADPDAMFAPWIDGEDDPLAAWRAWPNMIAVSNGALLILYAVRDIMA